MTRKKTACRQIYSILAFCLIFISSSVLGNPEEKPSKFDAGKVITEHISDSHEWHILTSGNNPISIPLPVILYAPGNGISVFSSSRFQHGAADYDGFRLEENKIVAINQNGEVDENKTSQIIDFSITKNVATVLVSGLLMILIFINVARAYTRKPGSAPKGLQSFVEPLIIFVRDDIAKSSIGAKKYKRFMPYLLTIFFFIWITNMLGLIPLPPGGANVTGNIAVTLTLAVLTFIITTFSGNKHYWRHIVAMPGVPAWVLFLLTPIEILGMFLRPFVLMIRLFANMIAGHIIALSFFCLIFIFGEMSTGLGLGVSIVSVAFTVFMFFLELLVAFLQAYVFTLLSAIYFGSAVEEHHDHDEHPEDHHYVVPEQEQQLVI